MTESLMDRLSIELDANFPALLDAHGLMVLTLATRLTDVTTGQDITQEVFLRAYRALRDYTPQRMASLDLRPWLATITRNLVRNEYRRRERKGTVPVGNGRLVSEAAHDVDHVGAALESEDEVNRLLAKLTDNQREAVVLRHIVGLPIREVALTMGCAEGTAKSHVSRGLSQLRTELTLQGNVEVEGVDQ